jgi:hypothetical protein
MNASGMACNMKPKTSARQPHAGPRTSRTHAPRMRCSCCSLRKLLRVVLKATAQGKAHVTHCSLCCVYVCHQSKTSRDRRFEATCALSRAMACKQACHGPVSRLLLLNDLRIDSKAGLLIKVDSEHRSFRD